MTTYTIDACEGWIAAAGLGVADWLCLAAAPTFAIMALLAGILGGGPPDMACSAMQDASPLSGMVPMYLLMSVFHSAPWLKLISTSRRQYLPVLQSTEQALRIENSTTTKRREEP